MLGDITQLCDADVTDSSSTYLLTAHYSAFILMSLKPVSNLFFIYIYIYYLLQHIVVSFEIIYSNLFGVYLLSAIIYLDFWICAGSICAFSMASLVCLLLWVRELKKKKKSTPVDNQKDIKCALCPPDQQHNQRVSAVCVLWETKTISRLRMGRH